MKHPKRMQSMTLFHWMNKLIIEYKMVLYMLLCFLGNGISCKNQRKRGYSDEVSDYQRRSDNSFC